MGKAKLSPQDVADLAELKFAAICVELGLDPSRPYKSGSPIDVGFRGDTFKRVQVKSTNNYSGANYVAKICKQKGSYKQKTTHYTNSDCDFIAIWTYPLDRWHIIPIGDLDEFISIGRVQITLNRRFDKYINAWHLLTGEAPDARPETSPALYPAPVPGPIGLDLETYREEPKFKKRYRKRESTRRSKGCRGQGNGGRA